MNQTWRTNAVLALVVAALAVSCVQKPRLHYSEQQLDELRETKELMRTLYHDLSPVWKRVKQPGLSPADLETISDVAGRVEVVSSSLKSKQMTDRFKPGFADRASTLGKHAQALRKAAAAGDEAGTRQAIEKLNSTCGACHKLFR